MTTMMTENGITVLTPADGMRLTDGETVADGEVYLGANAAPSGWREVTEAEAARIEAELDAKAEREAAETNEADAAKSEAAP